MSWDNVTENAGGGVQMFKIEPNQSNTFHVIDGEKGPKSFHSVYFASINRGATVDPNNNPLVGLEDGYKVKKRYALNVVDMSDGQVKVFVFGSTVANMLKNIREEYGNLDDIDIKISRKGTGLKTTYSIFPIKMKFTADMLDGQTPSNLDEVFELTSAEDIDKMVRGEDPRGSEDSPKKKVDSDDDGPLAEEDETPPTPKTKVAVKKEVVEEVTEDEAPPSVEEEEPVKAKPIAVKEETTSRASLLQAIKGNFASLKRYANPKQQLVDIQHFGGKDKQSLSQMDTASLQKMLKFQKTSK